MIKKLLNQLKNIIFINNQINRIEMHLAKSNDLFDLDLKIQELDKKGTYSKLYI